MIDYKEAEKKYKQAIQARQEIISLNRSNRMKSKAVLPVPEKPIAPLFPFAYCGDTYEGRLNDVADCPNGCVVRFEKPVWA